MSELRKLIRRGSTLGVVLPPTYTRTLGWGPGDYVEFTLDGDAITLRNIHDRTAAAAPPTRREKQPHAAR